jgi:hypothetical protein
MLWYIVELTFIVYLWSFRVICTNVGKRDKRREGVHFKKALYYCISTSVPLSHILFILEVPPPIVCVPYISADDPKTPFNNQCGISTCAVDREIEHRSGQTNDYENGICCLSTKHEVLRRKSKDGLTRNQDNVSEWGDMSIRGTRRKSPTCRKSLTNLIT